MIRGLAKIDTQALRATLQSPGESLKQLNSFVLKRLDGGFSNSQGAMHQLLDLADDLLRDNLRVLDIEKTITVRTADGAGLGNVRIDKVVVEDGVKLNVDNKATQKTDFASIRQQINQDLSFKPNPANGEAGQLYKYIVQMRLEGTKFQLKYNPIPGKAGIDPDEVIDHILKRLRTNKDLLKTHLGIDDRGFREFINEIEADMKAPPKSVFFTSYENL